MGSSDRDTIMVSTEKKRDCRIGTARGLMRFSGPRAALRVSGALLVVVVIAISAIALGGCGGGRSTQGHRSRARASGDFPAAPRGSLKGKIIYAPGVEARSLWLMNADGTGRRQITHSKGASDYSPSWAPDGHRFVFRTERGHYRRNSYGAQGIFVVDIATSRELEIEPRTGGLFPAWSPDGRKIAFTGLDRGCCGESIFLVNPDGSGLRDLRVRTAASECTAWSPDGTKIAFCGHEGDGNWSVWVMKCRWFGSAAADPPKARTARGQRRRRAIRMVPGQQADPLLIGIRDGSRALHDRRRESQAAQADALARRRLGIGLAARRTDRHRARRRRCAPPALVRNAGRRQPYPVRPATRGRG